MLRILFFVSFGTPDSRRLPLGIGRLRFDHSLTLMILTGLMLRILISGKASEIIAHSLVCFDKMRHATMHKSE